MLFRSGVRHHLIDVLDPWDEVNVVVFQKLAKEAMEEIYCLLYTSRKIVDSVDEAIAHINHYNTGHSEAIITKDYENAQKFLNEQGRCSIHDSRPGFCRLFPLGRFYENGGFREIVHATVPGEFVLRRKRNTVRDVYKRQIRFLPHKSISHR